MDEDRQMDVSLDRVREDEGYGWLVGWRYEDAWTHMEMEGEKD